MSNLLQLPFDVKCYIAFWLDLDSLLQLYCITRSTYKDFCNAYTTFWKILCEETAVNSLFFNSSASYRKRAIIFTNHCLRRGAILLSRTFVSKDDQIPQLKAIFIGKYCVGKTSLFYALVSSVINCFEAVTNYRRMQTRVTFKPQLEPHL